MNGMAFIGPLAGESLSEDAILTDGDLILPFRLIPRFFQAIDNWFSEKGGNPDDCLAVEAGNSLPSALLILYLLERGYGFLVLPHPVETRKEVEGPPSVPSFCRYTFALGFPPDGDEETLFDPSRFLSLLPNRAWRGPDRAFTPSGKLYLKTSGSTGTPKMTSIPHSHLIGNAANTADRLKLSPADRVALPVPIFHSYGLTTAFLAAIAAGASIDLQKGANLLRYLKRETVFQPNVAFMTPIFLEGLVKGRRGAASPYRLTVSAGDGFRGDLFSRYEALSGTLVNLYGSTEMGAIAAGSPEDSPDIRGDSVGRPMPGVRLRVTPKNGQSIEAGGDTGELWCQHPFGFEGYVDDEGRLIGREGADAEGWFHLKDLGRLRPGGYVQVLGRSDHSVNRDGKLVFFSDIERAMLGIPGMDAVIVVSTGEASRGRTLIAFCVPSRGAVWSEKTIRERCFSLLPRNAVPDIIRIIKSLPLLPNGKINRQELAGGIDLQVR